LKELSLHILDIVENSLRAGAQHVSIRIREDSGSDKYTIVIEDDGQGMEQEHLDRVLDPFMTTKSGKKVGMGLSLLAEAARMCGGGLEIKSQIKMGTRVTATFGLSHIDRQPMGDIVSTMVILIVGNPDVEFDYEHERDDKVFSWSTQELRHRLGGSPRTSPEVKNAIERDFQRGFECLGMDSQ
jgi:hypothetical protein